MLSCREPGQEIPIRLVEGSSLEGAVEISYNGTWSGICSQGWDDVDAAVACRHLGLVGGTAFSVRRANASARMTHVRCGGVEARLTACQSVGPPQECLDEDFAAVRCLPTSTTSTATMTSTTTSTATMTSTTSTGRFQCEPPSLFGSELPERVAFHPEKNFAFCREIFTGSSGQSVYDACMDFCNPAGDAAKLALQVGVSPRGLHLDQAKDICTSEIFLYNSSLAELCDERRNALNIIEDKAVDLLGQTYVFKAEQRVFKASIAKASADLQEYLRGEDFRRAMDDANGPQKANVMVEKVQEKVSLLTGSSDELRESLIKLTTSSDNLVAVVDQQLSMFEEFVEKCGGELLAFKNSADEVIMDICHQTGRSCFETTGSRHIGCCCGFNPILDADDGRSSLCSQAKAQTEDQVQEAENRLSQLGASASLQLGASYAEYERVCRGRRLQREDAPDEFPRVIGVRQLQDEKCQRLPNWDFANTAWSLCEPRGDDRREARMQSMQDACRDFCEGSTNAVPLLMGTPEFGFNATAMEHIAASVFIKNDARVQECHVWSQAFKDVEQTLARFMAALDIFNVAKMWYTIRFQATSKEVQELVSSAAFEANISSQGFAAYNNIKKLTQTGSAKDIQDQLLNAINGVRVEASALQKMLSSSSELMQRFLAECNGVFLGQGSNGERYLDICRQFLDLCVEEEEASHVGCSCGYHPFATFGNPPDFSIGGASDELNTIDVCAEAWTQSLPTVVQVYHKIRETLPESELLSKYPELAQPPSKTSCPHPLSLTGQYPKDAVFAIQPPGASAEGSSTASGMTTSTLEDSTATTAPSTTSGMATPPSTTSGVATPIGVGAQEANEALPSGAPLAFWAVAYGLLAYS